MPRKNSSTTWTGRPVLTLNQTQVVVGRLLLQGGINAGTTVSVVLVSSCAPPVVGQQASLKVGWFCFPNLEVADFDVPLDNKPGGVLHLVDPVLRAAPYRQEIFSSQQGSSFSDAFAGRVAPLFGPPAFFGKKFPAIVVEGTVIELLDDLCARNNWYWHRTSRGIEVGPYRQQSPVQVEGIEPRETSLGLQIHLTSSSWPCPGSRVRTCWREGIVLETVLSYQDGQGFRCTATIGQPPTLARCYPSGLVRLEAMVKSLDPFLVDVTREDGRTFVTRGRLMQRITDANEWRESVPVRVGDQVLVEVPSGGVSLEAPRVYLWKEGNPTSEYETVARTRKDRVEQTWHQEANELDKRAHRVQTTAESIEAHVKIFRIDEKR